LKFVWQVGRNGVKMKILITGANGMLAKSVKSKFKANIDLC